MKIIMVDASIGNDYTVFLCNGLKKYGVDVTLVVPENKEIEIPYSFEVKKWSPSKDRKANKLGKLFKYITYFSKLFLFIKRNNNPVVHYQFFRRRDEIFFYFFLKLTGVALYHTAHNVLPHDTKKYDFLLQKLVYKFSKGIIAHSQYIRIKIITEFNIKPDKIRVIHHGNFDFYLPKEQITKNEARKSLNLNDGDKVLLFFGGIRQYKGLDMLLDAFKLLTKENKYKLLVAGAPQTKEIGEHYLNKIKEITLNGEIIYNFNFIPNNEVASYFISSDVLVLPYKNIYHSGLIHLAYSFGKPVIATRVGDFEEVIEQDESGILLDENTPEDLAEKIRIYFSSQEKIKQMECKVSGLSGSKYSWDNIAVQTNDFYTKA